MQLTAKLTQLLPIQTGTGKNGEWKKQDIIVNTAHPRAFFKKLICVSIWDNDINDTLLQIGNQLIIDFEIESREFNGKWYTNLKATKIEVSETSSKSNSNNGVNTDSVIPNGEDDILRF